MRQALCAALAVLFLVSGCALRPTYVVGGQKVGSLKGTRAQFSNGNPAETFVSYRIFVDDPYGKHNIIVVAPSDTSDVVRVPIGRVPLRYEVYHKATYMTSRTRLVLINPTSPGYIQQLTIVEPAK